MKSDNKDIWIKTGYEIFALDGMNGLKIEPLAKKVGKSKSSFYHYFADMELFIEELLKYHLKQSCIIAEAEKKAQNIDPELISVLVEYKLDLLFSRQLRFHKNIPVFDDTVLKSDKIIGEVLVMVWVKDLNLKLSTKQLAAVFELAIENFYLQVNADNINTIWLSAYFANLKKVASNFA